MNILLLSPSMFTLDGGIERLMRLYLQALCETCTNGKIHSHVLNDTPPPPTNLKSYSNQHLIKHRGFSRHKLSFTFQSLRLARNTDLIICGHIHQLIVAKMAQLINPRLRYYLIAHGIDVWRKYTLMERWALQGAEQIICVSEYTRKQILRFYDTLNPTRLKVIFNALDLNLKHPSGREGINDGSLPTPMREGQRSPTAPVILSAGRLKLNDSYKGFDKLIEAMPQVLLEYPEAQLRIVGTGDALPSLRAMARSLGIAQSVTFTGRLTDEELAHEYETCTIFALPSRKEGFGLVYLEAMAYGKPCICAKAGGAPEVVAVPETGLAVEYGNISELAAAIIEILRHPRDPEVVRTHVQQFSYERFRHRLAELLPQ